VAHHPAGVAAAVVGARTTSGVVNSEYGQLVWPTIPGVLSTRSVIVDVVQLPDGSTALRADAQVVWVTPRPPSERTPPGSHLLRVSLVGGFNRDRLKQRPFTVTAKKRIHEIVALLNSLPAEQPGLRSCPADFGIRVRLALYAKRGVRPLAVAEADPSGCGGVGLSLGDTEQPRLEGGISLVQKVQKVLGVKFSTASAGRS
jgi:hypothetical protein